LISIIYLRRLSLREIFLLGSEMQVELELKTRQESARSAAPAPATSRKTKAPDMAKWVYTFGDGAAEGKAEMKNPLGGKGANLAEMANLGLPVPPGFTISTEVSG
jgi:hypothetical protein